MREEGPTKHPHSTSEMCDPFLPQRRVSHRAGQSYVHHTLTYTVIKVFRLGVPNGLVLLLRSPAEEINRPRLAERARAWGGVYSNDSDTYHTWQACQPRPRIHTLVRHFFLLG